MTNLPTRRGVVTADTIRQAARAATRRPERKPITPRDELPALPDRLPDTVTTETIARLAGVTVSCVQNWARNGLLPALPGSGGRGSRLQFDGAVVLAYLRKRAGGASC